MHRLVHEIPEILILFLVQLFLIFNQMLSIGSLGRPVKGLNIEFALNTKCENYEDTSTFLKVISCY